MRGNVRKLLPLADSPHFSLGHEAGLDVFPMGEHNVLHSSFVNSLDLD